MAEQLFRRCHVCALLLSDRSACVAERVPAYALCDLRTLRRRTDVIFHSGSRPVGLSTALIRTGEDIVGILTIRTAFPPPGEDSCQFRFHRYRLPARLCFHFSNMLTHDAAAKADLTRHRVNIS